MKAQFFGGFRYRTLDCDLKNELYDPLNLGWGGGGVFGKTAFSKMVAGGPRRACIGMAKSCIFDISPPIFDLEFKMAAASNVIQRRI